MAGGLPSSMKIEIEWTPGTWTDVTSWVASEEGMSGSFGRATEFDDCSPATWSLTLRNDDGRFTPDNPTSPYWPNVDENSRLRVTAYRGATAYPRFLGYLTSLKPTFPDADSTMSRVEIQAADVISALNRRTLATGYAEQANYVARYNSQWNDLFVFPTDGGAAATYFQNSGTAVSGQALGTATILTSASGVGTWEVSTPDVSTLRLDGQLALNPSSITGPVLKIATAGGPGQIDFFLNVPETVSIAPGGTALTVLDVWNESTDLFSLRLYYDQTPGILAVHLGYYNSAGSWLGGVTSSSVYNLPQINDGQWHKISIVDAAVPGGLGGTGIWTNIDDSIWVQNWPTAPALTTATRLIFGGSYGGPQREHKQTNCPQISLAGINVEQTNFGVFGYFANGTPPATTAAIRFAELIGYASTLIPQKTATLAYTSGSTTVTSTTSFFTSDDAGKSLLWFGTLTPTPAWPVGAYIVNVVSATQVTISAAATRTASVDTTLAATLTTNGLDRPVVRVNTIDSENLGEAFANLARTVGGVFWVQPNGVPELTMPDQMRLPTPIATLDVEADIEGDSIELERSVDRSPTQVTIESPIGTVILSASSTSVLPQSRRDVSISTGAATDAAAKAIAGYYLTVSQTLRITQIKVSLTTASNDLYAALLTGLQPGARVRVSGLPTSVFGRSYADVYVQGWTEDWTSEDADLTFDCTPADDPAEMVAGDATYGRVAGDSSLTLASPITAGATSLTIVKATGPGAKTGGQLSTAAGDYPLDLDVSGERITCPSAPSSGTRTNLVTNPSFETNLTGWTQTATGFTAGTMTAVTPTQQLYGFTATVGSRVNQVNWPTVASGGSCLAYAASGLTIGQAYTFSIYVWVPAGVPTVKVGLVTGTPSGVSYPTRADGTSMQDTGGSTGAWVRVAMTFTATATSHSIGLINSGAWTSGQVFYADAVLLELGSNLGSYFDGDNTGTWTGTANASTSTQPLQTFSGVTRGVSPSVARAHLAAEPVDIWLAARAAF